MNPARRITLDGIAFRYEHGVWVADYASPHGVIEIVLDGTSDELNRAQVKALLSFLSSSGDPVAVAKTRLSLGFWFVPIRIAINQENRVGIQFRHRVTRTQTEVFFV